MRELLSVEEYLAELKALLHPEPGVETLALAAASGRVLALPVASRVDIPVFDNSAMDGYAVRFADVAALPADLAVVGDVPAGSGEDPEAGPGECVRIMTGAPLPSFADTVVPLEDVTVVGGRIVVTAVPVGPGAHVRRAGEDIAAGALIAQSGTALRPAMLGALAASGVTAVAVHRRPVVAVCATGDELVSDGAPLQRGQIYESNAVALGAALVRDGAEVLRTGPVRDQPEQLVAWLDQAADRADIMVLTGGASVGAYDVVRDVLEQAGGTFRHVRMQPGKPQGWAVWRGTPVISLPGNPVSAVLSYEVFVRPLVDDLLGRASNRAFHAVAGVGWRSPAGRRQLVPVRLDTDADGRLIATPSHSRGSGSHLVTSPAMADGYAAIAEEVTEVAVGDKVMVRWL